MRSAAQDMLIAELRRKQGGTAQSVTVSSGAQPSGDDREEAQGPAKAPAPAQVQASDGSLSRRRRSRRGKGSSAAGGGHSSGSVNDRKVDRGLAKAPAPAQAKAGGGSSFRRRRSPRGKGSSAAGGGHSSGSVNGRKLPQGLAKAPAPAQAKAGGGSSSDEWRLCSGKGPSEAESQKNLKKEKAKGKLIESFKKQIQTIIDNAQIDKESATNLEPIKNSLYSILDESKNAADTTEVRALIEHHPLAAEIDGFFKFNKALQPSLTQAKLEALGLRIGVLEKLRNKIKIVTAPEGVWQSHPAIRNEMEILETIFEGKIEEKTRWIKLQRKLLADHKTPVVSSMQSGGFEAEEAAKLAKKDQQRREMKQAEAATKSNEAVDEARQSNLEAQRIQQKRQRDSRLRRNGGRVGGPARSRKAEKQALLEAEKKARREAKKKARREAEQKARLEAEKKARLEAEAEKKANELIAEEKAKEDAKKMQGEKKEKKKQEKAAAKRRKAQQQEQMEAEKRAQHEQRGGSGPQLLAVRRPSDTGPSSPVRNPEDAKKRRGGEKSSEANGLGRSLIAGAFSEDGSMQQLTHNPGVFSKNSRGSRKAQPSTSACARCCAIC